MSLSSHMDAALSYVERGWPVFPMSEEKRPLCEHGVLDATTDVTTIKGWWQLHRRALIALRTGRASGVVVLDVDVRGSSSGRDHLDELVASHPRTPTAHSPSGGFHLYFSAPTHEVPCSTSRLGPLLDVRGEGGSIILPHGPGRLWDPILNLETVPMMAMPPWLMVAKRPAIEVPVSAARPKGTLSRYGEAALDGAVNKITSAPMGMQETTLNSEVHGIGRLVAAGAIPPGLALDCLVWAARQMPSYDSARPWRAVELERKVNAAFTAGLRKPREVSSHAGH